MSESSAANPNMKTNDSLPAMQYCLWVDRVGSFLICLNDQVTFGGPANSHEAADISLLADLSREHATITRSGENYILAAHAPCRIAGRDVHDRSPLNDGYEIGMGESVRLGFRIPTALSSSARIDFLSHHRPALSADGIVLMDETCLIGPGSDHHVRCHDCSGVVLLLHQDGQLWCQSRMDLFVGEQHHQQKFLLHDGDTVTGPELRFRLEALA